MTKILFVCHGNICRSPMAEYFMKELVRREGLEDRFEIASAAMSCEGDRQRRVSACPEKAFRARGALSESARRAGSRGRTLTSTTSSSAWTARICTTCTVYAPAVTALRYTFSWISPTAPATLPIRGIPAILRQHGAMCTTAAALLLEMLR